MERVYSRTQWENLPSTATPIDEDNLNKMDYAIYEIDGRVIEHQRLIEGLQQYETRAAEAAAEAELSASEALSSQQASAISEANAKTSENNSRDSETNAKASETNAKTSELNAKESEDNAKASETNAAASETAAKSSEDNAKESEESAENAATSASNSAIESQESATQANQYKNASKSSSKDSEAWAVGQRGGIDVESTDPTYENNSKFYKEQSASSAAAAAQSYANVLAVEDEIDRKTALTVFNVDFTTGELIYTEPSVYTFTINRTTGNLEWEVA